MRNGFRTVCYGGERKAKPIKDHINSVEGTVTEIISKGHHPHGIAESDDERVGGKRTEFPLKMKVINWPNLGDHVRLHNLSKNGDGWIAKKVTVLS